MIVECATHKELEGAWPKDGLESVSQCPICGSSGRSLLHDKLVDRIFFNAPGVWVMYRCASCASGYLDPRPTRDTIGKAYETYYTHAVDAESDEGMGRLRRLRRYLARGYRNYRFGIGRSLGNLPGVVAAMLLPRQKAVVEVAGRGLPRLDGQKARLLDVGCGNGAFLKFARSAGWECVGVDFDTRAVKAARVHGLDVRHGGVEVLNPADEKFDGITLSHVIEHVHDPLGMLEHCYHLLKPGGWIWLDTPNLDALGHQKYGADWRGLEPPRHLVIFTNSALTQLLRKAGFVDVENEIYRPQCDWMFSASEAISRRMDPYADVVENYGLRKSVARSELLASKDVGVREFITIKAKRRS